MKYLLLSVLFLVAVSLAACEVLGVKASRTCSPPDKDGYSECVFTYTDYPACIGSCAQKFKK